jgi:hypothetical protein
VTRNDAANLVASHRFVEQEMNSSFTVWTGIMQPMSVLSSTWTVPQPRPCMRFAVILCDLVKVALAIRPDSGVQQSIRTEHSRAGMRERRVARYHSGSGDRCTAVRSRSRCMFPAGYCSVQMFLCIFQAPPRCSTAPDLAPVCQGLVLSKHRGVTRRYWGGAKGSPPLIGMRYRDTVRLPCYCQR